MTDQEPFIVTVSEYPPIRIVSPAGFDPGTAQTAGSGRLAAVAPQLGIQSALWGGLFEVKPGARTGIHHHGEQQTIAYVFLLASQYSLIDHENALHQVFPRVMDAFNEYPRAASAQR
jgi:uncharacterized RmlC-like cupin family protein